MCSATPTKTWSTTIVALVTTIQTRAMHSITNLITRNPSVWPISATTTSLRSHSRPKSPELPTKIRTFSVTRIPRTAPFSPVLLDLVVKSTSARVILSHHRPLVTKAPSNKEKETRIPSNRASSVRTTLRTKVGSDWVERPQERPISSETTDLTTNAATTMA